VGAYGHVLSCQALNTTASRRPDSSGAYLVLKAPERDYRGPRRVPSREVRIYNRQIGGEILPVHGYRDWR
jgi:hypothetical protein